MAEPFLTLSQVSKYYTGNRSVVVGLNNISLSFSRGEFVAITGESGSGKSTLSHVIGGILPYESGELYFRGEETSHFDSYDWERYRRDNISFISQNYGILPSATVMSNVVSALILSGMGKSEAKAAAERILIQVELWDMRRRRAAKLSSGQKQRLSIARALAKSAPILIADEPTGNLDPENSAKVISLLAEAAKDRLVILVTHEFEEAKDAATRHIILRDGKVVSDAELRPANYVQDETEKIDEHRPVPAADNVKKRVLFPYIARLQYLSRPVWTTIMMLLFAITAFSVFAFLGVFIISLDDTSTRVYDDSAFRNGSVDRIVAMRGDLGAFTDEDLKTIASIPHINAIEKNGYVADAQYAYRDGVDYITTYTESEFVKIGKSVIKIENKPTSIPPYITATCQLAADAPFIKTVPILRDGTDFITDGRLPENFYEVVTADKKLKIGDKVRVLLTDFKYWDYGARVDIEVTVVGVTDQGSGLYFHEDAAHFMRNANEYFVRKAAYLYMPVLDLEDGYYRIPLDLEDGYSPSLLVNSNTFFPALNPSSEDNAGLHLTFDSILESPRSPDPNVSAEEYIYSRLEDGMTLESIMAEFPSPRPGDGSIWEPKTYLRGMVEVSYNDFCTLTDTSNCDQISITIDGYGYTDRVIADLNARGYAAVSPYRLGSTEQIPERIAERTQTLRVCLAALAVIVVLQIVLLRAMFGLQTESYRLLSNIGLVSVTAKMSVVWQMVVFTAAGQVLGGTAIWISALAGVERIRELLSYLPPVYVMLLSAVHIAASALSTIWIIKALGRQVYPLSGKFEDIALDDGKRGE